jgi:acetyltransferase-like isoleucine patch superfamily enzyme
MIKRYGIAGAIKLMFSLIYTKLFFNEARLIRLPFDIRNKGFINLGRNLTTGFGCRIEAHPINPGSGQCISLGENIEINDYVHIAAGESITIGNNVLIASRVFISDLNHGSYKGKHQDSPMTTPNSRKLSTDPVVIKDNVWIGEGVCVMSGVTIGHGCIIGAMSVVTKDIPDYTIAVGIPARIVKKYNFDTNEWVSIN